MDQRSDVLWVCFPVNNQLCFTDLLADATADAVNAHDWTVLDANHLDQTAGAQDCGLTVTSEVVLGGFDLVCSNFSLALGSE